MAATLNPMTEVIDICPVSELPPGGMRLVEWEDLEIAVFNCNGEILAIEDRCSHDNGPLVEGELDQDDCTVADTIGAEDERYELIEDDAAVSEAVQILPNRARRILKLRFVDDMTQSEIAKQLDISQMQVSRVLRRSIDELREHVAA